MFNNLVGASYLIAEDYYVPNVPGKAKPLTCSSALKSNQIHPVELECMELPKRNAHPLSFIHISDPSPPDLYIESERPLLFISARQISRSTIQLLWARVAQ